MEIEDYVREIRRQRRGKNVFFGLAICFLVVFGGLSIYYSGMLDNKSSAYRSLQGQYNFLSSNFAYQRGQLNELQQEMSNVLNYYDQQRVIYQSPGANVSLSIWSRDQIIPPGQWVSWDLLDTFVNHIQVSSNATAEYIIVDQGNFVGLVQNEAYVPVVDNTTTAFSYTAYVSQGCSGYVLVIYNHSSHPILLEPNVTATYAPTPFLTGECSLTP